MVKSAGNSGLAVFRTDASPAIGSGHVMRCLVLADALIARGWRCGFACSAQTLDTVPQLRASSMDILVLSEPAEAEPAQLARHWAHADWLVVDHYRRDADFETACRPWARRILAIDDLADRPHDADCLLDVTLGRTVAEYAQLVGAACRLLLGADYALTRPQFAQARNGSLERRRASTAVRRVLISLGATDPVNATGKVLDAIAQSDLRLDIDVVLGSAAPHLDAVRAQAARMQLPTRVHVDIADMATLMSHADIAIGAGGGTSWERCVLALPAVVIITGDDQRRVASELARAGAIHLLGNDRDTSSEQIVNALKMLLDHPDERVVMSRRAACLCDGRGVFRVADLLAPYTASDGIPIRSRCATEQDMDLVFSWQSNPAIRRYFRNPQPPTRTEHERWFKQRLDDSAGLMDILMYGDLPAGVLRLDPVDIDTRFPLYEVSILVAPGFYRRGLGRAALHLARDMYPQAILRAEVHPDNTASIALFEDAGYEREQDWFYLRKQFPVNSAVDAGRAGDAGAWAKW